MTNPRKIASNEFSDILAMATMLFSTPRVIAKTEAIVVMSGMDESWRITEALKLWSRGPQGSQYLLIAGVNDEELAKHEDLLNGLKAEYSISADSSRFSMKLSCANTKEQADWICAEVARLKLQSLTLVVSPYHLLRAYCALLKSLLSSGLASVAMIPYPVPISPSARFHNDDHNGWELVPGELDRIMKYQAKGDVATYEEFRSYLEQIWASGFLAE